MKLKLSFDAYSILIELVGDVPPDVGSLPDEINPGEELLGVAYETWKNATPGIRSLDELRHADRERRDELANILANEEARVLLFVNRNRVDVWSIDAPIPTAKKLLKIVLPGERLGPFAHETLLYLGRGEHAVNMVDLWEWQLRFAKAEEN